MINIRRPLSCRPLFPREPAPSTCAPKRPEHGRCEDRFDECQPKKHCGNDRDNRYESGRFERPKCEDKRSETGKYERPHCGTRGPVVRDHRDPIGPVVRDHRAI